METWRLIDSGIQDSYMNMAIDEALVQLIGPNDQPILRFFGWSQLAISIGYSQKINDVLDAELCRKEGIPIVRRPTGGGVVFHGIDITYSVILPKGFYDLDIKELYSLIQSWVKNGLIELGIKTSQFTEIKKGCSDYCFISPSFGDIMIRDCKIGGLSGRRIRQKILCQGYLYFKDAGSMLRFTKGVRGPIKEAVNLMSLGIEKEEIKTSIINNWHAKLIKDNISDIEEESAYGLYETKYTQDEWNFMR